ncbi:hypothetical protein SNE40_021151 [Patella caerulea]|uniref:Uncharacterized protein n=1 Tax=Patella caerulea TaxID=87958 RepID=A0AAN8IX78_PATCE
MYDVHEVKQVLRAVDVTTQFTNTIRVGDPKSEKFANKPRPMRITAASHEALKDLKLASRMLIDITDGPLAMIDINADNTRFQREEMCYLVQLKEQKMTEARQAGNKDANWVVWRGKLVNMQRRPIPQGQPPQQKGLDSELVQLSPPRGNEEKLEPGQI